MSKLGSLFDGIGGFPFAASCYGVEPVWASEIEPFPVKVTKHHFPDMRHLGDITQINGGEIEPVDIVTFGSPCQDLSVAGKREGLAGERSGLFSHAVRIIRQMRTATGGKYPRFAVWENVPGAFSSNKGQDFRAVLEEIGNAEIPMPKSGRWATAGMVRTETADIAWRVLDAQYHGVPQRRRRIFLVADFAGQCASEILFIEEGLRGHFAESGEAREETAGDVGDGVEEPNCLTPWDCQSKRIYGLNSKWPTLYSGEGSGAKNQAVLISRTIGDGVETAIPINTQIATRHNKLGRGTGFGIGEDGDPSFTLQEAHSHAVCCRTKSPAVAMCINTKNNGLDAESQTFVIQNATRGKSQNGLGISQDDVSYTLDSLGNHAICLQGSMIGRADKNGPQGDGINEDVSFTLNTTDRHAVAYGVDCRNLYENDELSATIQAKPNGGQSLNYINPVRQGYAVRRLTPTEALRLQGFPDWWLDIEGMSDSAKYKAIGNSVAIPCVKFVLGGIARVLGGDKE